MVEHRHTHTHTPFCFTGLYVPNLHADVDDSLDIDPERARERYGEAE